jgi:hypothetical protein
VSLLCEKETKPIEKNIFTFSLFASDGIDFGYLKKLQPLSINKEVARCKMLESNKKPN